VLPGSFRRPIKARTTFVDRGTIKRRARNRTRQVRLPVDALAPQVRCSNSYWTYLVID
jgi:hypothetical protein